MGGTLTSLWAMRQALPQYVDDVTRDYGPDVYERMLRDPAVAAGVQTLKQAVLADGIRLVMSAEPAREAMGDAADGDVAEAEELRAFVQECFDQAETPIEDVAEQLLDGLAYGNKVAEIVLKARPDGRLGLRSVKGKHRSQVAFVVDSTMTLQGIAAATPESGGLGIAAGALVDPAAPGFFPAYKFVVFTHDPKDGDPRGTSALRPVYNAWYLKTQVLPDYFKYLRQFATPSVIGKPAEGAAATPMTGPDGTLEAGPDGAPVQVSAPHALLSALTSWQNASVLVVPVGTEIELLKSDGDGKAFLSALDWFDRQITTGILGSTRMTMEAEHGSKADSQSAQDVSGLRVAAIRRRLADVITRQLVHLLVRVNFGDGALRLAPKVSLARVEQQDWAEELRSIGDAYGKGLIHDSQLPALDERLGLPARDMEQIAAEKAEQGFLGAMAQRELSRVYSPAPPGDLAEGEDEDDQDGA